jgi:hypothetical protein
MLDLTDLPSTPFLCGVFFELIDEFTEGGVFHFRLVNIGWQFVNVSQRHVGSCYWRFSSA